MRILHTSDWHVGRTIRGRSRASEHAEVLTEIVDTAREREVDLVLVAGDLFDTAAPSPDAERLVYRTLLELSRAAPQVVVIAGNHDNPRRLDAVEPLLDLANVHTRAQLARPDQGGVIQLQARDGTPVQVALVPFLSQRSIVKADDLMALDAADHANTYADRCRGIVERLCERFEPDSVNVVLAHLTVQGGTLGGGEREAHTIFDYVVPTQVFPATAHYVALGHLHRAQKLPAAAPTWYCGAPLHLDFGETTGDRVVLIVEAEPGAPATVEPVPLTGGRRLRTLHGTLEQLRAQAGDVGDDHLRVVVEEAPRIGLADEVRELLPTAVDVTVARPDQTPDADQDLDLEALRGTPHELFASYLAAEGTEDDAMIGLFRELLEEVDAPDTA